MNQSKTTLLEVMIPQKRAKAKEHPPFLDMTYTDGENKRIIAEDHLRILGFNLQRNMSMQAHIESGEKISSPHSDRNWVL